MLELRSRLIETMKKCDILQFEKDLSENDVKRLMEALALNSLTTNVKSLVEMPKLSMVDQVNSTYAMEKKKRIEHDNLGGLDQLPFHPVQLDLEFSSLCPTPNRLQTPAPLGFYIMGDLSMIGYPIGIECDLPATRLMYASQLPCDAIMFALGR